MDDKPKNKPKRQHHPIKVNQNAIFFLISVVIGIMILFRLDVIIGAIRLQEVYPVLSRVMFMTLFIMLLILMMKWLKIKTAIGVLLILCVLYVGLIDDVPLRIAEWIIVSFLLMFPPSPIWLFISLFTVIIVWFITNRFNFKIPTAIITLMAVVTLFTGSFYVLSTGGRYAKDDDFFIEELSHDDKHYYLSKYCCYEPIGYALKLYECNSIAVFCEEVFRDYSTYWRDVNVDVRLIHNTQTNHLNIIVDGEILYQHPPR